MRMLLRALCATALIPLTLSGCGRQDDEQPTTAPTSVGSQAAAAEPMTREQATAATVAMWNVFDSNHDGVIDQADRQTDDDEGFKRIDANGDGQLSQDELGTNSPEFKSSHAEGRLTWFQRLDSDKSGGLTRAEVAGGANEPGQRERAARGQRLFEMGDTNKDGRVTKAEYDLAVKRYLDEVDANDDAMISSAEREAGEAKLRALAGAAPAGPAQAR
jgi:Ca2+-binding EF-hand superfamily protein